MKRDLILSNKNPIFRGKVHSMRGFVLWRGSYVILIGSFYHDTAPRQPISLTLSGLIPGWLLETTRRRGPSLPPRFNDYSSPPRWRC